MLILITILISIFFLYLIIKTCLHYLVTKYGKFSLDGFNALGFKYYSKEDIFYSSKNAWQKKFGYTHFYNVIAPLFCMIMDTETIKFCYQNKNWLITFWKGQYGIVTGGEIGLYATNDKIVTKKTIYKPVKKENYLNMSFILYKKGKKIAKINAKHWWLAIFKLGMFSNPSELSMDINITFLEKEMLNIFLKSFENLGYTKEDYKIIDKTFCFLYKKPHTKKVLTRTKLTDKITQKINQKNVLLYNECLQKYIETDKIDDSKNKKKKQIYINDLIPHIFQNDNDEEKRLEKNILLLRNDIYSKLKGESS